MGDKYEGHFSATEMNSICYGRRSPGSQMFKVYNIDYVFRRRGNPGTFPFMREKLILNVTDAESVKLHYLTATASQHNDYNLNAWKANANELRVNHYKTPDKGVFYSRRFKDPKYLVLDTSLPDQYREELMKEVYRSIA